MRGVSFPGSAGADARATDVRRHPASWPGNELKWSRNGNKSAVVFGIERRVPGGSWALIDMTKKREYLDASADPGVAYQYRVFAQNNGVKSVYSNQANTYDIGGENAELEVAAQGGLLGFRDTGMPAITPIP